MNYGLVARANGIIMIRLPHDFDLQMMSDSEFNNLLTDKSYRIESIDSKLAIDLIPEIGDLLVGKDYNTVYKLQQHEADLLLNK
jgi:hypothetical protein